MKVQDLRIGNYINNTYTVTEIQTEGVGIIEGDDLASVIWIDNKNIEPIPLDEQWLKDFGFTQHSDYGLSYYKDKLCLRMPNPLDNYDKEGRVYWNSWTINDKCIKHVHTLQNLFYSLTGEELELIK